MSKFKFDADQKLPDARWVSPVEIGVGDGKRTAFKLPQEAEPGRYIAFVRSLRVGKEYTIAEKDVCFKAAESEEGGELVFEEPVPAGAVVTVLLLGVKLADGAFQILPMTTGLQREIEETRKKELRKKKAEVELEIEKARKDRDEDTRKEHEAVLKKLRDEGLDVMTAYRMAFRVLVKEWVGVEKKDGTPHVCDDAGKDTFLNVIDGGTYGSFVLEASQELQAITRKTDED